MLHSDGNECNGYWKNATFSCRQFTGKLWLRKYFSVESYISKLGLNQTAHIRKILGIVRRNYALVDGECQGNEFLCNIFRNFPDKNALEFQHKFTQNVRRNCCGFYAFLCIYFRENVINEPSCVCLNSIGMRAKNGKRRKNCENFSPIRVIKSAFASFP